MVAAPDGRVFPGCRDKAKHGQAQTPQGPGLRTFNRAYLGFPDQLRQVRAALVRLLDGCPVAGDAVLLASEIASNAVRHSNGGKKGGQFTVRAELHPGDYVWIEVEDQGGPWEEHDRSESHGLPTVARIAGDGNWGDRGQREWAGGLVPARLERHMTGASEAVTRGPGNSGGVQYVPWALADLLHQHGVRGLYGRADRSVGVLSVSVGLTVWSDGGTLRWMHDGRKVVWQAADLPGAAARLADLVQRNRPHPLCPLTVQRTGKPGREPARMQRGHSKYAGMP